jgi:hypothetical protein
MRNKSLQYAFALFCFVGSVTNAGSKLESYCRVAVQDLLGQQGEERPVEALNRLLAEAGQDVAKALTLKNKGRFMEMMFYPVLGPIRVAKEAQQLHKLQGPEQIWRAPFRIARKDAGVIVGALTIASLNGHYRILQVDFDHETRDFEKKLGQEPYVLANLVDAKNTLGGVPRYDFDRHMGRFPNTYFVEARSDEELNRKLVEIRRRVGPIYGLEVFGHGAPGRIPYEDGSSFGMSGFGFEPGLLQKNAQIKLNSCDVGNGSKGDEYVRELGMRFLPEGGTIYSSRVSISSNLFFQKLDKVGISGPVVDSAIGSYQALENYNPLSLGINALLANLIFEDKFPMNLVRITQIRGRK